MYFPLILIVLTSKIPCVQTTTRFKLSPSFHNIFSLSQLFMSDLLFSLQHLLQRLDHLRFYPLGIDFLSHRRYSVQKHHHRIRNSRFVVLLWEIVQPVLFVENVIRPEGESQTTIDEVSEHLPAAHTEETGWFCIAIVGRGAQQKLLLENELPHRKQRGIRPRVAQ